MTAPPPNPTPAPQPSLGLGSLLDDPALDPRAGSPPARKRARRPREPFPATARRWWEAKKDRYRRSPGFRRATWAAGAILLIGGGTGLYLLLRPTPVPDYLNDPLDGVLDFTFLSDEFNRLPVEQRAKLIGDLVKRVKGMGTQDSLLMAAFAAGISGKAREQLEENASRLVLDMMDQFATGYTTVPAEEKAAYIDTKLVEMVRLMSSIAGEENTQTDEEILADAREQAERDQRFFQSGRFTGNMAGRMFQTLDSGVASHSSPHQKARVGNFLRDMTRHLRGQDVRTGKPLPAPPGKG